MSLTSMLRGETEEELKFQHILKSVIPRKPQFSTLSGKLPFSNQYNQLAKYTLSKRTLSPIVGTAFDYIARFTIARNVESNRKIALKGLVAWFGMQGFLSNVDSSTKFKKCLLKKYDKTINLFEKYIFGQINDINIIVEGSCFFAELEHYYRSGWYNDDFEKSLFEKPNEEILNDLMNIYSVFIEKFMIPQVINHNSVVIYNPTFGTSSRCVGGADADIFIDGTLYDFKSTKKSGYQWLDVAQIVSYYLLSLIAKEYDDHTCCLHKLEITRVAFYRARYGEIEYFDISDFGEEIISDAVGSIIEILNPQNFKIIK